MQTLQLTAVKREAFGKKNAKALRREGMVPAVIYGGNEEVNFAIAERDLKPLIYTPNAYIVELNIDLWYWAKHAAARLCISCTHGER